MVPLLQALSEAIRPVTDVFTVHHIPGARGYQSTIRILTREPLPQEFRESLKEIVFQNAPAMIEVTLEYPEPDHPGQIVPSGL